MELLLGTQIFPIRQHLVNTSPRRSINQFTSLRTLTSARWEKHARVKISSASTQRDPSSAWTVIRLEQQECLVQIIHIWVQACNGCESDGPDNCFECATGFKKGKNDVCVADKNAGRVFTIDNTRYFTYAGLVIATCIIFHKNWVVASLVGGFVAIYISCTELYLANNTLNGDLQPTPGTLDAIQQQFAQGMPGMGDMGDIPPEDMM